MPQKDPLLFFDKPHFQVKLHRHVLEVDLKEGTREELEKLAEARPILQESLGWLFQTIIPLDVLLHEIESVEVGHDGKLHLKIPHRRDINIPLTHEEATRLAEMLNHLIPEEKQRKIEHELAAQAAEREKEERLTKDLAHIRRS